MVSILQGLPMTVVKTRPIEEAIITSGGICIKEVNPKTMGSKIMENLFFAGEIWMWTDIPEDSICRLPFPPVTWQERQRQSYAVLPVKGGFKWEAKELLLPQCGWPFRKAGRRKQIKKNF